MRTFQGTVKLIVVLCISVMPAVSYAEGWPSTLRSETITRADQPHVVEMPNCPVAHDMRESKRTGDRDRTEGPDGCDQHSCFLKCFHSKDVSANLVRSRVLPSDFRINDSFAPKPLVYKPPTPPPRYPIFSSQTIG